MSAAERMLTWALRYGQTVTLEGDGREVRAFLQPMTERTESVPETMTTLGGTDGRRWLYLGPERVAEGEVLLWAGRRLRVRSSRPFPLTDRPWYWWAVLDTAREAAE